MKYDLRALTKQKGIRRKKIGFRKIEPTNALVQLLAEPALRIPAFWQEYAADRIEPLYAAALSRLTKDDESGALEAAIAAADSDARRLVIEITAKIDAWALRVERWHRDKFGAAVKAKTGIDPRLFLTTQDAAAQVAQSQQWASGLIRDISDASRRRIETIVYKGLMEQTPRKALAKEISEAVGIEKRRAMNIARDQTMKLAGNLDRLRQSEAGIDQFTWRHSGKVHLRPEHLARDGKVYRWDDPKLAGDLPRMKPNCGCGAEAFIDLEQEA